MSFHRSVFNLILGLVFFIILTQTSLAWAPTHKVESGRGRLYLRVMGTESVLFCFVPKSTSAVVVEDGLLWDPDYISDYSSSPNVTELKIGEALETGGQSQVFCFLNPVSGRLTLEVRYKDEGESNARRIALEVTSEKGPFSRVLTLRAPSVDHLYGLGEQFPEKYLGDTRTDWKGRVRHSGAHPTQFQDDPIGVYGNSMTFLAGGNVGNAMFPVLHMVDEAGSDAMLFLDNASDTQWDFTRRPWRVKLRQGEVRGALAWGEESQALRSRYLAWTGRPPVPPRKAFGLWVSEYGYENWEELEDKEKSLRENRFPVDGFVLDLQWFGGIEEKSPDSQMGTLTFDLESFPDPAAKIAELGQRGLGIIVIEESYIASNLDEFSDLAARFFLVRTPTDEYEPQIIDRVPWWGIGSMIDYTNPDAGEYWHKTKRKPLVEMGVMGHWTDLGEPEIFRHVIKKVGRKGQKYVTPLYFDDKTQLEANNLFCLNWARSIFEGYGADGHQAGPRPLILARTGTSGIQRFGAALWSGDIAANWNSLRSHYAAQGHMAFSGVDYFGSDVGGFYRKAFGGESSFDELYTRWFGAACLTDIPLRPHTMNLGNNYETAPDRVGDRASNLKNLRLRYRLIPYLYGAAYEAMLHGTPVISPLAMEPHAKMSTSSGTVKRIGPALVAQLVLEPGLKEIECELPEGDWYDFATGEEVSSGRVLRPTLDEEGRMTTPLFARASSIVSLGSPETSEPDPERLEIVVFPGADKATARVFHDDGVTEAYNGGAYAVTEVSHNGWKGRYGKVVVEPARGAYRAQLPARRDLVIRVASDARVRARAGDAELEVTRAGNLHTVTLPSVSLDERVEVLFN
jgi:alpha-glucosidase (family GH31 glycosyl hydrolase)